MLLDKMKPGYIILAFIFIISLGFVIAATIVNDDGITTPEINNVLYVDEGVGSDIQDKIDQCPDEGCLVMVPPGYYQMTAQDYIDIKPNVYLIGSGSGVTKLNVTEANATMTGIFDSSNAATDSIRIHNVSISGFTVHANNLTNGLITRWTRNSVFEDIKVYDSGGSCIFTSTSNAHQNFYNNIWCINSASQGIYLDTAERSTFNNIVIDGTRENDGILMRQSEYNTFTNILIRNTGTDSAGGFGNGIRIIEKSYQNKFSNIQIIDPLLNAIDLNAGNRSNIFENIMIDCADEYGEGIIIDEGKRNIFSNSYIEDCSNPIHLNGAEGNIITNNRIVNPRNGSEGIYGIKLTFDAPYNSDNNIISNNIISALNGNISWGIRINDGPSNNTFIGNRVYGNVSALTYSYEHPAQAEENLIIGFEYSILFNPTFHGEANFSSLNGTGSSIACLDANGNLYRGNATGCP